MSDQPSILEIRDLRISIATDEGTAHVLNNVDLSIPKGKILGLVGESGCGKTTLTRAILGTLPATARVETGVINFNGKDLLPMEESVLNRTIRGSQISFIPQDPFLALNPVFKIGDQLLEILRWHSPERARIKASPWDRAARSKDRDKLIALFKTVQLPDAEQILDRYPHEFSGGQRQRLLIAAALACEPALVIADEPTTALDVTTQSQILKLLKQLSNDLAISVLLVTHDFGVVAQLCDEVCIMYAGQTVESGSTMACLNKAYHPYTKRLIACHPDRSDEWIGIPGSVPSPYSSLQGCRFYPRCDVAEPDCQRVWPNTHIDENGHRVNCIHYTEKGFSGSVKEQQVD